MSLAPEIDGSLPIRAAPAEFQRAFRDRVAAGLLAGRPHPRSRYRVTGGGPAELRVRAEDLWTAINVGLNEVELRFSHAGAVRYRVRFWRWTLYAVALSGVLGLAGIGLLLAFGGRGDLAGAMDATLPGGSVGRNLFLAWAMVLFWGFVWPWLLVALHKRPLRRLLARIVAEVDARAAGGGVAGPPGPG